MAHVAQKNSAAANHGAHGEIQMPRLRHKRDEDHAGAHDNRAQGNDKAWSEAIHECANDWRVDGGGDEAERKGRRRLRAVPAKLFYDGGK